MDDWHATYLGLRRLPRDLSGFELEAFFSFTAAERSAITERRGPALRLSLALQVGFLRMSGRLLDAIGVVPPVLWKHLGQQFGVDSPDLASLRAMYRRRRTLFEQQEAARSMVGFGWIGAGDRRVLTRALRQELERVGDRERLLAYLRRRLYEERLVVARERELRAMIAAATRLHEAALARTIRRSVPAPVLSEWEAALLRLHRSGSSVQRWLWAAPAKHSTRQIDEMLSRYELLHSLGVDRHLSGISDVLLRRYARRLGARPPSIGARIQEPARTIEVACFMRYCLLLATDQLLLMVRRQVAELWRQADVGLDPTLSEWGSLYRELMVELAAIVADHTLTALMVRGRLARLLEEHQRRRPRSRAELVRGRLIDGVRPVRALLKGLVGLPWRASAGHPVTEALKALRRLYDRDVRTLPEGFEAQLGRVWQATIEGRDRDRAFKALEVATLLSLRRALRNGTVWVEHSLAFRSRERLFLPEGDWQRSRLMHYRRLGLPRAAARFLDPLVERALNGMAAVARAAAKGELQVDDELHLTPLAADEQDPRVVELREALDQRIGEAQLPEIILAIDASVRFSWIMLGREPRSSEELLMVYAGDPRPWHRALGGRDRTHDPAAVARRASARPCAGRATRGGSPRPARRCLASCNATRSPRPGAARIWLLPT